MIPIRPSKTQAAQRANATWLQQSHGNAAHDEKKGSAPQNSQRYSVMMGLIFVLAPLSSAHIGWNLF